MFSCRFRFPAGFHARTSALTLPPPRPLCSHSPSKCCSLLRLAEGPAGRCRMSSVAGRPDQKASRLSAFRKRRVLSPLAERHCWGRRSVHRLSRPRCCQREQPRSCRSATWCSSTRTRYSPHSPCPPCAHELCSALEGDTPDALRRQRPACSRCKNAGRQQALLRGEVSCSLWRTHRTPEGLLFWCICMK